MHIHILALAVIIILAALAFYVNRRLTPPPIQNWIHVLIVVVAVLLILVSLGLIGSSGVSVGP